MNCARNKDRRERKGSCCFVPFKVKLSTLSQHSVAQFQERLMTKVDSNQTLHREEVVLSMYLYDAVYLYLLMVIETVGGGHHPKQGGAHYARMSHHREFNGELKLVVLEVLTCPASGGGGSDVWFVVVPLVSDVIR